MQIIEIFFPDIFHADKEIATKPDKFKENRHVRNKGHKEGKEGAKRNLGTSKETTGYFYGPGQNVKQRN